MARARIFQRGGYTRCYDPRKVEKQCIKGVLAKWLRENNSQLPSEWPRLPMISFVFAMPVPVSTPKPKLAKIASNAVKHIVKPDVDNLVKLYLDCMDGVIFTGDQQVSLGFAIKIYSHQPRTIIWIQESDEIMQPSEVSPPVWGLLASEFSK